MVTLFTSFCGLLMSIRLCFYLGAVFSLQIAICAWQSCLQVLAISHPHMVVVGTTQKSGDTQRLKEFNVRKFQNNLTRISTSIMCNENYPNIRQLPRKTHLFWGAKWVTWKKLTCIYHPEIIKSVDSNPGHENSTSSHSEWRCQNNMVAIELQENN